MYAASWPSRKETPTSSAVPAARVSPTNPETFVACTSSSREGDVPAISIAKEPVSVVSGVTRSSVPPIRLTFVLSANAIVVVLDGVSIVSWTVALNVFTSTAAVPPSVNPDTPNSETAPDA